MAIIVIPCPGICQDLNKDDIRTNFPPLTDDVNPEDIVVMPTPSGSTPTPSGSTPTPSGSTPTPSGSTPTPSGSTPTPSGSTPTPSGSTPTPSGSTPTPSGSSPTPSGSTPTPSGSESTGGGSASSDSYSYSISEISSSRSSSTPSGTDPWNGETRKIDRWLAKCGEVEAGKWFLKRGGTYIITYQEYLNLLSVGNFTGMDIWMCRGNPGDRCEVGEILVESGKDPGTPPWNCVEKCFDAMLVTMGFYAETVRIVHINYCSNWSGASAVYGNIKRGDWYVEIYTGREYDHYPIRVSVSIIYAATFIGTHWDEEKQEMVEIDDGVSWIPETKGAINFNIPVTNPLKECCVDNFISPEGNIELVPGDARWYSGPDEFPPLPGSWGWSAGDYYCWFLNQDEDISAYWLKFEMDKTEEGE